MTRPINQKPFSRVHCSVLPNNLALLMWDMNKDFPLIQAVDHFYVQISEGGEWCTISEEITDCMFVDEEKRRKYLGAETYYRIVAVDTDGHEYASTPINYLDCMSARQWKLIRDVLRKEMLRFVTLEAGVKGYLLKRRQYGPKCTECNDYDLEESVNGQCESCYGTGYAGGYYNAIPYYIDNSLTESSKDVSGSMGVQDNRVRNVRSLACPQVQTYDMFVSACGNKRFVIRRVRELVNVNLVPVVYNITLMEIQPCDAAYDVPLEQCLDDIDESLDGKYTGGFSCESITSKDSW